MEQEDEMLLALQAGAGIPWLPHGRPQAALEMSAAPPRAVVDDGGELLVAEPRTSWRPGAAP